MWGVATAVAASMIAAREAELHAKAKDIRARAMAQLQERTGIVDLALGARPSHHAKCPSCGSRHFIPRGAVEICAYCRSER